VTVDTRQFLYSRNGEPLPEIGSLSTETFRYSRNNEPYPALQPSPPVIGAATAPLQTVSVSQPAASLTGNATAPLQTVSASQPAASPAVIGTATAPLQTVSVLQPAAHYAAPKQNASIAQFDPTATASIVHGHRRVTVHPPLQRILISQFAVTATAPSDFPRLQVTGVNQFAPIVTGEQIAAPPLQTVSVRQLEIGGVAVTVPAVLEQSSITIFQPSVFASGNAVASPPLQTVNGSQPAVTAAAGAGANAVATPPLQRVSITQTPINYITLLGIGPEGSVGVPIVGVPGMIELLGIGIEGGIGTPTLAADIILAGIGSEGGIGTASVTGGVDSIIIVGIGPEGGIGTPSLGGNITLPGFWELNAGALTKDDYIHDISFAQEMIGTPSITNAYKSIQGGIPSSEDIGRPYLYDVGQISVTGGPPPSPFLDSELSATPPSGSLQNYFAALMPDSDSFDLIWRVKESDGTDTIEWKVPISHYDGSGSLIVRTKRQNGTTIVHPINHVTYTIRKNTQHHDQSGTNYYQYVAYAPHYDLNRIAAIPFATEAPGTSIGEIFACLERVTGWRFGGGGCLPFTGPSDCAFVGGPQFSSQEASVLTELFQISSTFGGVWRWDEFNHYAFLECSVGAGSSIVADYKTNLLSAERTEEDKPQQQVLVTEDINGVIHGESAAMALLELQAEDACEQYQAELQSQLAQQNNADNSQFDPCTIASGPSGSSQTASLPTFKFTSNALKSQRTYLRELYLLSQAPQVTYSGAVLDTSMLQGGSPEGRIPLGRWVTFKDDEADIHDVVRCVGADYNLLEPEKTSYQFDNEVPWENISNQALTVASAANAQALAGLLGVPKNPKLAPGPTANQNSKQDTSQCLDDAAIEADWIPPPTCVGKGQKLVNALEDKQAQYLKLLDFGTSIQAQAEAALGYMEGVKAGAEGQGVNLPVGQFINGLHATIFKIKQAILTAEVAVLQAQQDLDNANEIAGAEGGMWGFMLSTIVSDSSGGSGSAVSCDSLKGAADKAQTAKNASDKIEKGHWQWSVQQFKVGDCPPDPLPSDATNMGVDSGLDKAVKSTADGACYFARITANNPVLGTQSGDQTTHGHINCGDITTDTTETGGSGSGAGGGGGTPIIDGQTMFVVYHLLKDMVDANVLLNKQWDAITKTDKLAEELRNNVKECVAKASDQALTSLALCDQQKTDNPPQPTTADGGGGGNCPEGQHESCSDGYGCVCVDDRIQFQDKVDVYRGFGNPLTETVDGSNKVTGNAKRKPGDLGQDCITRTQSLAKLASGTAQAASVQLASIGSQLQKAENARIAATETVDTVTFPWGIDSQGLIDVVSNVRAICATIQSTADTVGTSAKKFGDLSQVGIGMSSAANALNVQNAKQVKDSNDTLNTLQGLRADINQNVSDTTASFGSLTPLWSEVARSLKTYEDGFGLWAMAIAGIEPQKFNTDTGVVTDHRADALNALAPGRDALAQISSLTHNAGILINASGAAGAALLDAVDCADAYLVSAGVDIGAQRTQSVVAQNTWAVDSPTMDLNPDALPTLDPDYDRVQDSDGRTIQRMSVRSAEPDNPNVNDVWIKTETDYLPPSPVPSDS
jgi:hypothetical protein